MYLYLVLFFILGLACSIFIEILGFRLPLSGDLFRKSYCDKCNHDLKLYENIPIISFIVQKGRCNYCHQRISKLYLLFEIATGIIFALTYFSFHEENFSTLMVTFGILFVSSLLIICFSDIKYMIIPDEILIIFIPLIIVFTLFLKFCNEELVSLMDLGYAVIDIIIDIVVMYLIMLAIKKIGDLVFKKESLGKGDVKLMAYIAIVLGIKLSIVTIFIASFIALPFAIISNLKKDKLMLPFGPCLAIAAIILFLLKIDFSYLLSLIH